MGRLPVASTAVQGHHAAPSDAPDEQEDRGSSGLEGEFSEDGLAAMAGDDNMQLALAKSMAEKIDQADMQRSWSVSRKDLCVRQHLLKLLHPTLRDLSA